MTPEQLALLIRKFLLRAEKRSALLLLSEFDKIKAELAAYLIKNGADPGSLEDILAEVEHRIATRTIRFSSIVTDAQRHVVRQAAKVLNAYLSTSIFEPDKEALQKLIGRAQDGGSLTKLFGRLNEPVREAAKKALLDGFAEGLGARQIASKLKDAADIGYSRALITSRTETVMAYREASKEFYKEAGIKKYVWMAVLDPRTCMVCWRLHGSVWPTAKKVTSHPACRCTLIPVTKDMKLIETGAERFSRLEPAYQKQILGPKRYEIFTAGTNFGSFVGTENSKEYGLRHFVTPLDDLRG